MNPKILAAVASAAVITGAAPTVDTWPGDGKCQLCTVVVQVDDKTIDQRDWEICGPEQKDKPLPNLVRVVKCADPYEVGKAPAIATAATISSVSIAEKVVELSIGSGGCACADQRKDAKLCEWYVPARAQVLAKWEPAPANVVVQAGLWRGPGCLPSVCVETEVRSAPGSQIPSACKKG